MPEWLFPILLFVAYFVIMRWILPRLGIST